MRCPAYKLEDFLVACAKRKTNVMIWNVAKEDARNHFNLDTTKRIFQFIVNTGRQKELKFYNSKRWDKNPNPDREILVDAYDFYSGFTFGYLAFFFNPITSIWTIKSFHRNDQRLGHKNFGLADQLEKIILQ